MVEIAICFDESSCLTLRITWREDKLSVDFKLLVIRFCLTLIILFLK